MSVNPKNILIIAPSFRNKGHETMTVVEVRALSRIYPGARITIASYMKDEVLSYGDHEFGPISPGGEPARFILIRNRDHLLRPIRMLLCRLVPMERFRAALLKGDPYLAAVLDADMLLDQNGRSMSDERPLWRRVVYCFEIVTARFFNKPFIIFTQTLGPFRKPSSKFLAGFFLPKADLILVRGKRSYRHLEEVGVTRKTPVFIHFDSAVLFQPTHDEKVKAEKLLKEPPSGDRKLLGICPSMAPFKEGRGRGELSLYIESMARLCDHLCEALPALPIFICHEPYDDRLDDGWLIREIVKRLDKPDGALILPETLSAGVVKAVISRLDFLVTSRYHPAIAAMSIGTPFLCLGSSHKFDDLADDLGIEEINLSIRGLSLPRLLFEAQKAWDGRVEMRRLLLEQRGRLMSSAKGAFDRVEELWPGKMP